MNLLTVDGLIVDIFGALLLAQGIIFNPDRNITIASQAYWGSNPFLVASMIEQKIDATVGLCLLLTGFMLQLIGSLGMNIGSEEAMLLLGPFGVTLSIYDGFKRRIVVARTLRLLKQSSKDGTVPDNLNWRLNAYLQGSLIRNRPPE